MQYKNKTLGRARDPHANSAWLIFRRTENLSEEQDRMEERLGEWGEERGLRKGAIVSSSPQGMTSWSSSIKICFFQAYRMHYLKKRCHDVKQYAKYVPLVNRM